MKFLLMLFGVAGLALPIAAVWAQDPDPADPNAVVPPYVYESSFSQYISYQEGEVQDWLMSHEDQDKNGNHKGMDHMKMPSVPDSTQQNGGDAGHNMHMQESP